jgi:hypothetical protein
MGLVLYNIPSTQNFTRNPIRYKVGTDIDVTTPGLYIEALVEFQAMGSATWAEVIRYPLSPDSIGVVEIDLSRIAHRLLEFATPSPANMVAKDATTQTGNLRVTFTEYDADTNAEGGTALVTDSVLIVKGGLSHERYQSNIYFDNRYNTHKFLTWLPATREQLPWVNDYISYLHLAANAADAELLITVTFTDATTDTISIPLPGGATQNHVYHIPCGYANCAMAALDANKKVWKYTVQVMDDVTELSEEVTYIMKYDGGYETFHLSYFNSLGGFESIALTGDHSLTINREYDLVDVTTNRSSYNGATVPAMSRMNRVAEQTSYRANIGVVHGWNLHDLRRELFLSTDIFTRKNNRWWPVNVLDKSADFGPVSAQIKEVPIEWSYAFSNTQYTPQDADMGNALGFEFTTQCPVISYVVTDTKVEVTFTHAPAPVQQYDIVLVDQDDIEIDRVIKTIPYSAPIVHEFTGLTPVTEYRAHLIMRNTDTGESRTCIYSMVTTNAEGETDPGTPSEYAFEVALSNDLGTICGEATTTVYSTDSVLGTGSVIYVYVLGEPAPVSGYTLIKTPDGYSYHLSGNTLLHQTGFAC